MPAHCLLISQNPEDVKFAKFLCLSNELQFVQAKNTPEIRPILEERPNTIVLWDVDDTRPGPLIAQILQKSVAPIKVFAISDKPLNKYPYVFKTPAFGHHLLRRYEQGQTVYSKIASAVLKPFPFGLLHYVPLVGSKQKITLTRSSHKVKAVQAIESYFIKQGTIARLGTLIAQAADELIMNAIFDAPIDPAGKCYRRLTPRGEDFELVGKEAVDVEVAATHDYIGLCVTDQFGSLKKDVVLNFLRRDYSQEAYHVVKGNPSGGIGLLGVIQAGFSLLFVSKPFNRTDVMLFFPKVKSYKEFREGFRFLSIISE